MGKLLIVAAMLLTLASDVGPPLISPKIKEIQYRPRLLICMNGPCTNTAPAAPVAPQPLFIR